MNDWLCSTLHRTKEHKYHNGMKSSKLYNVMFQHWMPWITAQYNVVHLNVQRIMSPHTGRKWFTIPGKPPVVHVILSINWAHMQFYKPSWFSSCSNKHVQSGHPTNGCEAYSIHLNKLRSFSFIIYCVVLCRRQLSLPIATYTGPPLVSSRYSKSHRVHLCPVFLDF